MIPESVKLLLKKREFIDVASCDFTARPNVAPKFLLKLQGDFIYLVDYIFRPDLGKSKNKSQGFPIFY